MTDRRWANPDEIGSSNVFEALHAGLTVSLISTHREDLMTCVSSEPLSDVMEKNKEPYDFLPVVEPGISGDERIIGLFSAASFFNVSPLDGFVGEHFEPLSEDFLIGADASILNFVRTADEKPCRMVVSGARIIGLVSLSDLQKLPVRAALFALITGFEITMSEAINARFGNDEDWKKHLSDGRLKIINREIEKSHQEDGFVDDLLFTQFCDKADIIIKSFQIPPSKTVVRRRLEEIQNLRDNLAHANEYAASPGHAGNVCAIVRHLLALRQDIASTYSPDITQD